MYASIFAFIKKIKTNSMIVGAGTGHHTKKSQWTKEHDSVLTELIAEVGLQRWQTISTVVPGRQGKQCRERWNQQLNPLLNKEAWTAAENWLLFFLYEARPNHWTSMTDHLVGRPDNAIKNHWNTILRHKRSDFIKMRNLYIKRCEQDSPANSTRTKKLWTIKYDQIIVLLRRQVTLQYRSLLIKRLVELQKAPVSNLSQTSIDLFIGIIKAVLEEASLGG